MKKDTDQDRADKFSWTSPDQIRIVKPVQKEAPDPENSGPSGPKKSDEKSQ